MSFIYLASPYTAWKDDGSLDATLMNWRYHQVTKVFHNLTEAGLVVYSPISMTGACEHLFGYKNPEFWYSFDNAFLQFMRALFVLELPGWDKSKGVGHEIDIAKSRGVPITHLKWFPN